MQWIKREFWMPVVTFILLILCMVVSPVYAITQGEVQTITVMAEQNLAIPLAQISSQFVRGRAISVSNNFGASEVQKKKIEDGESADIFITAQTELLELLKTKGLIDVYSVSKIAQQNGKSYAAVVVAGENMTPARVFLDYLKSADAKRLFEKNGFTTP